MDLSYVKARLEEYERQPRQQAREAAVLIALVPGRTGPEVVLEVRARTLDVQPGEVCLPGGGIEPGESPRQAAVRETCEELLVSPDQIQVLGSMGAEPGPGGRRLHVFVAELGDYAGTYSPDEVERTFTLPVEWLASHEPQVYEVTLAPAYPDDFPWDLVPGGRSYPWRGQRSQVPFYPGTDPVVWGATARVLRRFARILGDSRP